MADDYVAWLRYKSGNDTTVHLCDSDTKGAFKVYRAPRWIPVAQKPPRDPESGWASALLLFFGGDGDGSFNLGYYDPEDREWMAHDGGGYYEKAVPPPTHWMPLPEPPEDEEE